MSHSLRLKDVKVGQQLPNLVLDVSARLIVAGALASRDFQNVHHDKAGAQTLGSPDIFMNILTTNGLVGRYVTDWTGPAARLKKVSIKLGAPNYPGDTMTFTGEVAAVEDDGAVEVAIKGSNSYGHHVTGTVLVALPKE